MAAVKLKKLTWLKKRFARSAKPVEPMDWINSWELMKDNILTHSNFQIVEGQKCVVELDLKSGKAVVLIEVVGVPSPTIETLDVGPCEVLVYHYPQTAFEVDFLTLKLEARALMNRLPQPLEQTFHIVFDGNDLALHFFVQKDYIETT